MLQRLGSEREERQIRNWKGEEQWVILCKSHANLLGDSFRQWRNGESNNRLMNYSWPLLPTHRWSKWSIIFHPLLPLFPFLLLLLLILPLLLLLLLHLVLLFLHPSGVTPSSLLLLLLPFLPFSLLLLRFWIDCQSFHCSAAIIYSTGVFPLDNPQRHSII